MLFTITQFIGRLHPALVHLPIGILLTGSSLQLLYKHERYRVSLPVIKVVFLGGCISAWVTCLTGYLLSLNGDYETALVNRHLWFALSVAVVSLLIYRKLAVQQTDRLYRALSAAMPCLIFITGHFGGSLTHGTDYLTAGLQIDSSTYVAHPPISNIQEAKIYADVIQPIFQKECYNCHSAKRQKGNLRLDDSIHIMKGGKNGPSLISNRPSESEILKRLLLPKEDEHHMPKEHPSLKEDQIDLITWWIAEGADFNKKVKAVEQPGKISAALLTLQSNSRPGSESDSLVPSVQVDQADPKSVNSLKEKGVEVVPVARNSHYLVANFVNAAAVRNEDMELLVPLQKQLIGVKLGNTDVGDAGMAYIAKCPALTSVQLNNTRVTDKGIVALQSLVNLQSLNLVGTFVTAQGIASLNGLKKLKHLYFYKTGVVSNDWAMLKKHFPKTILDSGGYQVSYLAADTTVLKEPLHHAAE